MNSFEEKHAAWVDGRLKPEEEESFLRDLQQHSLLQEDRDDLLKLGALLKNHGQAPSLSNAEFFTSQVMDQIRADAPSSGTRVERPRAAASGFGWLWRMALAGTACLAAAAVLYFQTVPQTPGPVPEAREYIARVLEANPGEGVTAITYQSPKSDMTIVWLEGLEYVPEVAPTIPTPTAHQ